MTSRDFCYWLQGYLEISSADGQTPMLTPAQTEMVQKHLSMVFVHEIDPSIATPGSEKDDLLNKIHKPPQSPSNPYISKPGKSGILRYEDTTDMGDIGKAVMRC